MQGVSLGNKPSIQALDSTTTNVGGKDGLLNTQKDAQEGQTEAKFGEVWNKIQTKYGAKADKPREIKKTLGKDDFLNIMITQMKHQDPTQPFKAEQFATQMAQFTSVEQMQNMNNSLVKMANQNQPLERLAMTNMIGKTITVDRERFPHTEGQGESLAFTLARDAKQVKVTVVSDTGETILEKQIGEQKGGDQSFTWDGIKSNTLPAKTGTYLFKVEATDERGNAIPMNSRGQTNVVGVSFEGSEAVFLTGDLNNPSKVSLRNVIRIESSDAAPQMIPGARPLSGAGLKAGGGLQQQQAGQNFFSFEKGVGSTAIDPSALSPEASRALAMAAQREISAASARPSENNAADTAKNSAENSGKNAEKENMGFPNGLSSGDN